jgi:hypothetical protein
VHRPTTQPERIPIYACMLKLLFIYACDRLPNVLYYMLLMLGPGFRAPFYPMELSEYDEIDILLKDDDLVHCRRN